MKEEVRELLSEEVLRTLIDFRKEVHSHPELSGEEGKTARRVVGLLSDTGPDEVLEGLGGNGVAFVYEGREPGETILLRCELDALPIREVNTFEHRSSVKDVSHKCGHDGHLTILAGVGKVLKDRKPLRGRVVLLFQPAEETGEGACRVVEDPAFERIRPDRVFALHNLPGFPMGSVLLRNDVFASASKGMEVFLDGKTSHAGEPENGISPGKAMADLVRGIDELPQQKGYEGFVLVTVIHALLGSVAFGTSPGHAEVRATLRAHWDQDLDELTRRAEALVRQVAERDRLSFETGYRETFPSTVNAKEQVELVQKVTEKEGLPVQWIEHPFRWSEDFGVFTGLAPGALFGLGSGEQQPDLHNPDYDFPDELIFPGISVFSGLIDATLGL